MRGFFTGREKEKAGLLGFLEGAETLGVVTGKLYSIRGAPGIGKTELCKAALREFLKQRPECRAYFVDATGTRNLDGLCASLADALANPKLAEDRRTLLGALEAQADLLYLDNLEDALPESSAADPSVFLFLEQLASRRIKILASSRQKLGSMAREFPLDRFSAPEALEAFRHFWREAGGEAPSEESELARFLDEDLDHHALTIRLLAAQADEARTWQNLRELWRRFRTRLAHDAGREDRLSNLDVSIRLSFDRVERSAEAARVWISMACFPEGMSLAAQESLFPEAFQRREAMELLVRLSVATRGADGSLDMLAPLRQFAAGLDPVRTSAAWAPCLGYFLAIAQRAKATEFGTGEGRAEALSALAAEFSNLREAVMLATADGRMIELVTALDSALFNSYQFHAVAARELVAHLALYFSQHGATLAGAGKLKAMGDLARRLGDVEGARKRYDEALKLFESEQANLGRANTLKAMGDLAIGASDLVKAARCFEEALSLYASEQTPQGIAQAAAKLAVILKLVEQSERAAQRASTAREAAQSSGIPQLADWVSELLARVGL